MPTGLLTQRAEVRLALLRTHGEQHPAAANKLAAACGTDGRYCTSFCKAQAEENEAKRRRGA